ncbi:RING-H2 finger protein ATL16-like [Euphorbia lathyris]|uniref:RING-H2 finger protein ATL16-like n=1 Tax=Euphorbia lathyris TaxID=212925 RepID=UPI0033139394
MAALASLKIHQNPIIYQTPSPPSSSSSSSDHAFPMLAIAVFSIISSAFLLFSYYFFVNKCCSIWHNLITLQHGRTNEDDSFIAFSPAMWINRGLDESIIREIPIVQYKKGGEADHEERSINIFYGCVVCLNEFQELDMVRVLPNCSHSFHLDCIDIWLQSNANCPLCRTSISGSTTKYPFDQIIAPSSSPQGSQQPYSDPLMGGDEDFVVIELGSGEDEGVLLPHRQQETEAETMQQKCQSAAVKIDQKKLSKSKSKRRKRQHVSIMGDECIDTREKDDQFSIQPIRRSFSLDSAVGEQLYSSVQAIIQQNTHKRNEESSNSKSNRSVERSFLVPFYCQGRDNLCL